MLTVTVPRAGGPEVLDIGESAEPTPGAGQILVRVVVAGVNFMDVYQRTGVVDRPTPFVLGVEGAGLVTEVSSDVGDFEVGDRVGWFSGGSGSFAESAVVDADRAVRIPPGITFDQAAAVLMQGLTAHYLASDTYPVRPGDTVLVHAAAGGVGRLLTQVAKLRGGRVIGTASTPRKADVARAAGADDVVGYEDFAADVRRATGGIGVAAVYDGIGATTFDGSLASLRPRGVLVIYGTAGGPTPLLDIRRLNAGGSLYVTRPSIAHYASTTQAMRERATEVFQWVAQGKLTVSIGGEYRLDRVGEAFRDLEGRHSTGKILLRP